MFKKTKHGIEIDSQAADKGNMPKFGKRYPSKEAIADVGHEMKKNPPSQLKKTKKKFGKKRERAQKIAIMMDKARKA